MHSNYWGRLGFFCDLSLKFIPPINIWKICIDLRLFSKIRTLQQFVIQRSVLLFRGWQPNFQKLLQNFEVVTSKLNIEHPLTSMASKTAGPKFLKIASNQCKYSKYWWEVWILGRGLKKTKCPQQWGVIVFFSMRDDFWSGPKKWSSTNCSGTCKVYVF